MSDIPESTAPSAPEATVPEAPSPVALARQLRRLARLGQAPWLHEEVARRLAAKLAPIRLQPDSWIDWSAHLGGGAEPVQAQYPEARRWVVEPHPLLAARSTEALQAQRSGWLNWLRRERPQAYLAPVPDSAPWLPAGVPMLWANMTLHASADLPGLMAQWHRHLAVDGFLMCSGLGPDTARELRQVYAHMGWRVPTIQFIDMHDLGDELVKAGFTDPVMDMERLTLTWPSAQAMLDELRTWGGNVAWGRFEGLRTPAWRLRMLDAIEQSMRGPDGRIALTVELVNGHAIKPAPRAMVAPETRVSLDDMRKMVRKKGHP